MPSQNERVALSLLVALCVVAGFPPTSAEAAVSRIEIKSRTSYADGRGFGAVGPYETLRGKVYFDIDPSAPANRNVVDVMMAPRTVAGRLEFSADVEILVPVDRSKVRGTILYDVNNRGNKLALGQFNGGADEFLMREGYVVVWSGWIAETMPGGGRLRLSAPVAWEDGHPIVGIVRSEVVVDSPTDRANLAQWANQGSYQPTERGELEATLTVRLRESDARTTIPRDKWRLEQKWVEADGERGQLPQIDLVVPEGLKPGHIYEVVYEAQGSIVQGLGMVGIRDLISHLRYDKTRQNPLLFVPAINTKGEDDDEELRITRAIGFGVSQSGRCLRTFLYDGFNADERGRIVFDGVIPHVAGGGLGFFNHRFGSPTRHNTQHDNHLFPADVFPFAYGDEHDPLTDRTDGILRRCREQKVVPKVMHTQSSSEYWHRAGSLVHTNPTGKRDAMLPPEVRVYAFGGTQHGAGSGQPDKAPGRGQLIGNPADYRPLLRGLLTAMDAWIREGTEPPPSVYPRIDQKTLADWRGSQSGWKPIVGVSYPQVIQQPAHVDRGPEFREYRRSTIEPPKQLGSYDVRVPGYDADNRELGTLDLPDVAVPVGTYTSWNLRSKSIGAETELLSLAGGYIPLSRTADERKERTDPRRSLAERYVSFDAYLEQHAAAAKRLVEQRYVLEEDLPRLAKLAESRRGVFEANPN